MKIPALYLELAEQFEARNQLQVELFGKAHRLTPVRDLTVWQIAGVHARVFFRNPRGQVFVDGLLVLESLALPSEDREWVVEGLFQEAVDLLEVGSLTRGIHRGLPIEIRALAKILGDVLDEGPVPAPARAIWARSWKSEPYLTDKQAAADELCRH